MSREIELTQGKVAIVDDDDYEELSQYHWYAYRDKRTSKFYAARSIPTKPNKTAISMHRHIMGLERGDSRTVDHKNVEATLDNRRSNLRIATRANNTANRGKFMKGTSSQYKGVSKHGNGWVAGIGYGDKDIYLGKYSTEYEAHLAYCRAALKYHGEFANFGHTQPAPQEPK